MLQWRPRSDRFTRSTLGFAAICAGLAPLSVAAQESSDTLLHVHEPFFVFPDFINITFLGLEWRSLLALALLTCVLIACVHRKSAKTRHKRRIEIFGQGRGKAFMILDVLAHAVWRGRFIDEDRVGRAVAFARDLTETDYTEEHIREAALEADRLVLPLTFSWMRNALSEADQRRIFETALAVMLESGPLSAGDRAFLRTLTRAIGLGTEKIGDLRLVIPA